MNKSNNFTGILFNWFDKNKRMLPWRSNKSWYSIWISEVMLQQTQVIKVIPYYNRFLKKFPDLSHLAAASIDDVLLMWQGLGYYRRVHNLHKAACIILKNFNGELPRNFDHLKKLPGFGDYITAAVLSIAWNLPYSAIDGNIKRVISRLFAFKADLNTPSSKKRINRFASKLMDKNSPGKFNESLMELGAMICLPQNPKCDACPVNSCCHSRLKNLSNQIPLKSLQKIKPDRFQIALIIFDHNRYYMGKKKNTGLLSGLWEFPVLDSDSNFSNLNEIKHIRIFNNIKHSYTHFNLIIKPVITDKYILNSGFDEKYEQLKWIDTKKINLFAVHKVVEKIIEQLN